MMIAKQHVYSSVVGREMERERERAHFHNKTNNKNITLFFETKTQK
jgi:hypothetical protein